jgi:hypothetical protein
LFRVGGGNFESLRFIGCTSFATLDCGTGNIGDFTISDVSFASSSLSTAVIDAILVELDSIDLLLTVAGSVDIDLSGNSAPTGGASNANVVSLAANGYNVIL